VVRFPPSTRKTSHARAPRTKPRNRTHVIPNHPPRSRRPASHLSLPRMIVWYPVLRPLHQTCCPKPSNTRIAESIPERLGLPRPQLSCSLPTLVDRVCQARDDDCPYCSPSAANRWLGLAYLSCVTTVDEDVYACHCTIAQAGAGAGCTAIHNP